MKLEIFKTAKEQSTGLHKYKNIPRGTVFWFPYINIIQDRKVPWIETAGFSEPIKVYFLDTNKQPIPSSEVESDGKKWKALDAYQILLNPDGLLPVPASAVHLVETSYFMNLRPEFGFLRGDV